MIQLSFVPLFIEKCPEYNPARPSFTKPGTPKDEVLKLINDLSLVDRPEALFIRMMLNHCLHYHSRYIEISRAGLFALLNPGIESPKDYKVKENPETYARLFRPLDRGEFFSILFFPGKSSGRSVGVLLEVSHPAVLDKLGEEKSYETALVQQYIRRMSPAQKQAKPELIERFK